MRLKQLILSIGVGAISAGTCLAQECRIWNDYVSDMKKGKVAELPDFSYAGYHHGEKAIPDVTYKVFNVTDFGAVANDGRSDKAAIEKAVKAAQKNGSGVIFFPKGRFRVNEDTDTPKPITIKANNIVFRGSGSGKGGTELYMKNYLIATDTTKMWTSPAMFNFTGGGAENVFTTVTSDAPRGTFTVKVKDAKRIKSGDWIVLRVKNNDKNLVHDEMCGCPIDDKWTSITKSKGVYVNEYHQVAGVKGNKITFKEPIMRGVEAKYNWQILTYAHFEEVGVEDIAFIGNWKRKFKHHRSWLDDGGYTMLKLSRLANSWVRRCRFTDVNRAASASLCANVSILDCDVTGTPGHNSISSAASTRVLIGKVNDSSSQWHAPGVTSASIGTVLWRVKYNEDTSFESHASQPRATLFDAVEGGFFLGRGGGARQNLPNHHKYLVLWNYKELGEADHDFEFWSSKTWYWKIIPPIVVGFHGAGTTFKKDQIQVLESVGTPVNPESLYEAQLELRLGYLPQWVKELK